MIKDVRIYLVRHAHRVVGFDDDVLETKIIGIFSGKEKAINAIDILKNKQGFSKYPDDFSIEDYEIDAIEWDEGFAEDF